MGEDVVGDVGDVAELEAREVVGEELLLCELARVDRGEDGAVLLLLCELVTGGDGVGLVDVDNEELVDEREELCRLVVAEVVIVDN